MTLRKLSKDHIKQLIAVTRSSLLKTVDILSTEFKIYSWEFLSYEALAVVICYIYAKIDHLTPDQVQRVRQWFWRSAFGERYKVGGEGFVSNDLKIVYDFVVNSKGSSSNFGSPPGISEWMDISFRSNVSRSRAYILALAAKHPRNLTNGSYIDPTIALSSYNKKQFHHVFPRAYLRRQNTSMNDNLLINICMIAAAANNAIRDSDPNHYLPACSTTLGQDADAVFSSNLLPKPSSFDYSQCNYERFLEARAQLVAGFVNGLCEGSVI